MTGFQKRKRERREKAFKKLQEDLKAEKKQIKKEVSELFIVNVRIYHKCIIIIIVILISGYITLINVLADRRIKYQWEALYKIILMLSPLRLGTLFSIYILTVRKSLSSILSPYEEILRRI